MADAVTPPTLRIEVRQTHVLAAVVLIFVLALAGVYAFFQYKLELAKADAKEQVYNVEKKAWEAERQRNAEDRARLEAEQDHLMAAMAVRNTKYEQRIVEVTKPKDLDAVLKDVVETLKVMPVVTQDKLLAFDMPTVQNFVATKIELAQCAENLVDTETLYSIEKAQNATLSSDLVSCKKQVTECEGVTAAYKKVAKKSWIRKVGDVAFKVALPVVGAFVGYKLGRA